MPRLRTLHDDKAIGTSNRRAASKAARLVERLLDRADELRGQGDDKGCTFATRAAQATAIAGGVSYDKSRLAEDRPTVIHGDTRDADDYIRSLTAMGVLEGTATELKPRPELPPAA